MRRTLTTLVAAVLALLLVGLLVFGVLQTGDDSSIDQALARGEHPLAHDASLPLLDGGGSRTLADYRSRGGWVVVNFFASWCEPCSEEAPLLNRLQHRLAGRGTIVGVAWNDATGDTRSFVREHRIAYPVLRDVNGTFAAAYGVKGMPETFVIDARGRIVALQRSQLVPTWIASAVDPLLARGAQRG
ncbi:MAG: TlpA family protein disulfide reductase [Actinobacteria bacterium]|nr:TlpA family protein disulfide reductase [Actinomycetota bacterium]